MNIDRAREVLGLLAEGINPVTGEILPNDDSCNQVEVVRALYTALRCMEPKKATKNAPENAGRPWTEEDEGTLCEMFDAGTSTKEICAHFKRSKGAVAARLVRLGKIQDRYALK